MAKGRIVERLLAGTLLIVNAICVHVEFCNLIKLENMPCRCDDVCEQFGDCCPDYDPSIHVGNQPSLRKDLENVPSCDKVPGGKEKFLLHVPPSDVYNLKFEALIPRCLSPRDLDPYESTPVYNTKKGIHYRNIFCAVLLDVWDHTSFVFWNIEVSITCYKKVLGATLDIHVPEYYSFLNILFSGRLCYPSFTAPSLALPPRRCDCLRECTNQTRNVALRPTPQLPVECLTPRTLAKRPSNESSTGDRSEGEEERTANDRYIDCLLRLSLKGKRLADQAAIVTIATLNQRTSRGHIECEFSGCIDANCPSHGTLYYFLECVEPAASVRGNLLSFGIDFHGDSRLPETVNVTDIVQPCLDGVTSLDTNFTELKHLIKASFHVSTRKISIWSEEGMSYMEYLAVVKQLKNCVFEIRTAIHQRLGNYSDESHPKAPVCHTDCDQPSADKQHNVIVQILVACSAALVLFMILKVVCKQTCKYRNSPLQNIVM